MNTSTVSSDGRLMAKPIWRRCARQRRAPITGRITTAISTRNWPGSPKQDLSTWIVFGSLQRPWCTGVSKSEVVQNVQAVQNVLIGLFSHRFETEAHVIGYPRAVRLLQLGRQFISN